MHDVDFVLPVKAPAPFLHETVSSILGQTVDCWRVIAVVDGRDDDVVDLLKGALPAGRLTLHIHEESQGLGAALNSALFLSEAPFCARIDADDLCEPMRLEAQLDFLRRVSEVAVLGSAALLIDQRSKVVGHIPVSQRDVRRRLLWRNQLVHSSVMFRRKVITDLGGYRTVKREDYELWLRVARVAGLANLNDELVRYRIVPGQESSKPPPRKALEAVSRARRDFGRSVNARRLEVYAADALWRVAQSPMYRRRVGRLSPSFVRGT